MQPGTSKCITSLSLEIANLHRPAAPTFRVEALDPHHSLLPQARLSRWQQPQKRKAHLARKGAEMGVPGRENGGYGRMLSGREKKQTTNIMANQNKFVLRPYPQPRSHVQLAPKQMAIVTAEQRLSERLGQELRTNLTHGPRPQRALNGQTGKQWKPFTFIFRDVEGLMVLYKSFSKQNIKNPFQTRQTF